MNKYRLTKAGINVNEGISRFNGEADFYEKYLMQFLDDDHYEQMITAIKRGDVKEAFSTSHSLKGITGNLSMTTLYEALVPLVDVFRAGTMDGYEPLLEKVTAAYSNVMATLVAAKKA